MTLREEMELQEHQQLDPVAIPPPGQGQQDVDGLYFTAAAV